MLQIKNNYNVKGFSSSSISYAGVKSATTPPKNEYDLFVNNSKSKESNVASLEEILQDPAVFEELYLDKPKNTKMKAIQEQLKDPKVIEKVMSNPKVMEASTKGLLQSVEKQFYEAYEKGEDQEKIEKLAFAALVLNSGLASFEDAPKTSKSKSKEAARMLNLPPSRQVAFGGLLNYGFTDWLDGTKPSEHKKAEQITNRYATLAAGTAGALAQVKFLEPALLTTETKQMCKKIFRAYGRTGGWIAAISSTAGGFIAGSSIATAWLGAAPGAGNAANATITYSLHQLTGRACMMYCENMPIEADKKISDAEAKAKFVMKLKNQVQLTFAGSELLYNIAYKVCDTLL